MKTCEGLMMLSILLCESGLSPNSVAAPQTWPHPIPCRIHDNNNPDVMVMTLGDVKINLADGMFDPVKDEVKLKDGTAIQNYYKDSLGVKYLSPIDKSIFPLPPSGWCSWYYYYMTFG